MTDNIEKLFQLITAEEIRQREGIELIASENFVSDAVLKAQGSVLTNKYAEGYPGKRYYGGCEVVDQVEQIAIDGAKTLFGAEHANVQPHSGSSANLAVYRALLNPGDKVLGMDLAEGGHLTHGSPVNFSGQSYEMYAYGVNNQGYLDYDRVAEVAHQVKPKMIIAGASSYSRIIDFEKFGQIARQVGALLMVDMAHIAGLVAAGLHPNPVPYADVVTSTTHKTLRGPRGGLILSTKEWAAKIDKAIFPGIQGGPLEHVIAAKAVAFQEAMTPAFKAYSRQTITNAQAMAQTFMNEGIQVVTGGTDNHLMLINLTSFNVSGKWAQDRLGQVAITVNKNAIPKDQRSFVETSGIRIGTPAMTTRGMDEAQAVAIAHIIIKALAAPESDLASIKAEVIAMVKNLPLHQV